MIRYIILILLFLPWGCALAAGFEAEGGIDSAAKKLQSELPKLSIDGLFQAKRNAPNWKYSFWLKREKYWFIEVRINLEYINVYKTHVKVKVVKVTQGLLSDSETINSELSEKWSAKTSALLKASN